MAASTGVTVGYPIDELLLDEWMDDGWTHIELFYSNTPEGPYTSTGLREELVAETYDYEFEFTTGTPGQWGKVVLWDGSSNSTETTAHAFPFGGGTTLATLRRLTGLQVKDMTYGSTTSAGSTTQANCTGIEVTRFEDDHFNGKYFHRTDTGAWTQVSDFAKSGGVFTLSPAIASVGDAVPFEVTARFTPSEYRDAINWAIEAAYPTLSRTIVYTGLRTQVLNEEDIYAYRIPHDIRTLNKVEVEEDSLLATTTTGPSRGHPWRRVAITRMRAGLVRSFELKQPLASERRMRLTGTGPLSLLYNDSDCVEAAMPERQLIVDLAAHRLFAGVTHEAASTDIDRFEKLGQYNLSLFASHKKAFAPQRAPQNVFSEQVKYRSTGT